MLYVKMFNYLKNINTIFMIFNMINVRKTNLFFFFMFCTLPFVKSQTIPDSISKNNFHYKKVIKLEDVSINQLEERAQQWLKNTYKNSNIVSKTDTVLTLKSEEKFLVYTKGMISKEIHGRIKYDIILSLSSKAYSYSFENFFFEYYKQNRQYEFVSTGKLKSLKEEKFPGWQGAWNRYRRDTKLKVEKEILSLESFMNEK